MSHVRCDTFNTVLTDTITPSSKWGSHTPDSAIYAAPQSVLFVIIENDKDAHSAKSYFLRQYYILDLVQTIPE